MAINQNEIFAIALRLEQIKIPLQVKSENRENSDLGAVSSLK